MEKIGCGMAMANTWTDPPMVLLYAFVAFFASWVVLPALSYVCFVAYGPYGLAAGPAVIGVLYLYYQFVWLNTPAADCEEHLIFTDEACKKGVGQEEDPDPHLRLRVPRRQDPLQEGLPRHAVGLPRRVHRLAAVVEPVLVPALPAPAEPGRHPRGAARRRRRRTWRRRRRRSPSTTTAATTSSPPSSVRAPPPPRNSGGAQFRRRQRSSSGAQFGLSAVHSLRLTSAAAAPPCAQARR